MNSDTSQLTGQKRTLPASIASADRDSDCASVSELDCSFKRLFCFFPVKLRLLAIIGILLGLLQYYHLVRFGYLGNTSVVQHRGNTIAIVFCAALVRILLQESNVSLAIILFFS